MKKIIIVLGIILTSGVAALALSQNNNSNTELKTAQQIKAERTELVKTNGMGNFKSDIATAD